MGSEMCIRDRGGVVVMLFVAGLIEGFLRQLIQSDGLRYAIGGIMLLFWLFYFFMPRKQSDESYEIEQAIGLPE